MSDWEGYRDAVLFPLPLLDSVCGAGNPPWIGMPGEAHRAPLVMSPQMPIGRARCSIPPVSPAQAAVRRAGLYPMRPIPGQERDPPAFSAGKTGKSLNTLSSIRRGRRWRKDLAPQRSNCLQKPKRRSRTCFRHLLFADLGQGVHRLQAKETALRPGSISLLGAPGRNVSILAEQAGRTGITPRVSMAVETRAKPDTHSVSGPWQPPESSGADSVNHLRLTGRKATRMLQESSRNQRAIEPFPTYCAAANTPGPVAPTRTPGRRG